MKVEQKPQHSGRIHLNSAATCWLNEELPPVHQRVSPSPLINALVYDIDDHWWSSAPGRTTLPPSTLPSCSQERAVIGRLAVASDDQKKQLTRVCVWGGLII